MSKPLDVQDATGNIVNLPGIGTLIAYGTTVPSDGADGYATGCIFIHIDGGDGTALYINEGTTTTADFNAVNPA